MPSLNPKTPNNQLLRPDLETYKKLDKKEVVLILDNIRSGLNIGSIFRSADAFLVKKIYLSGICAVPPNKEILKTALGATESVEWEYVQNIKELIETLHRDSWTTVVVEQTQKSIPLTDFSTSSQEKYAVIVGNEVEGVQQYLVNLCKVCVEIPQGGTKHSLNVAVAAGIVLWDLFSKTSPVPARST